MSVRSRTLLALIAACLLLHPAWGADREVALSASIPFAEDAAVDVSRLELGNNMRENIVAQ